MQLTNEPDQAGLPESTVLLGLLAGDTDAVVTFIDLVDLPLSLSSGFQTPLPVCIPCNCAASTVNRTLQAVLNEDWSRNM